MRNIYILLLLILAGCSESDFNSKSQATNFVDKNGFRDGKWVDFFDSDKNILKDTSDFYSYVLSEYENGKPINEFKEYFKNGQIKARGTFSSKNVLVEKNIFPEQLIGTYIEYNYVGDLSYKVNFDENSRVKNKIFFLKKDSVIVSYSYFKDSSVKSIELIEPKIKTYKFLYLKDPLVSNESLKKNYNVKNYKKRIDTNFPTDDKSLAKFDFYKKMEYIWVNKLLSEDYSILHLDKVELNEIKNSKLQTIQARTEFAKMFKGNSNSSTTNSATNSISNSSFIGTKYCSYCNKRVNESFGYVSSLATVNCAKKVSSVIFELSVAKQGGFSASQLNQVATAYKLGTYYCSRKCVYLNGESICN